MKSPNPMTVMSIKGMHCGSCVKKVTIALQPLCELASVSLNPPVATLKNATASITKINEALAFAGDYKASKLITEKTFIFNPEIVIGLSESSPVNKNSLIFKLFILTRPLLSELEAKEILSIKILFEALL
jgi:copper chaperone CopZ